MLGGKGLVGDWRRGDEMVDCTGGLLKGDEVRLGEVGEDVGLEVGVLEEGGESGHRRFCEKSRGEDSMG